MSSGRIFAGFMTLVVVAVCVFAYAMLKHRSEVVARCESAGGVSVKSYGGPRVCIDRHALIEPSAP